MIITPLSLMSIPLVLVVWALDSILFLVFVRLGIRKFKTARSTQAYASIQYLTEPLPHFALRWLSKWKDGKVPKWAPWFCVILSLFIVRYFLVFLLLQIS